MESKMKTTILIHNVKGGTGKTTITIFLGEYLRLKGHNTIILDLDYQQANACQYFTTQNVLNNHPVTLTNIIEYVVSNINELLNDDIDKYEKLKKMILDSLIDFESKNVKVFACIASNLGLEETNNKLLFNPIVIKYAFKIIKKALLSMFDVIVVDTPPSISPIVQSAYSAFDNLLIVSDIGEFGLTGINKSINLLKTFKHDNPNLNMLGILINKYENNNYNKAFLSNMEFIYSDILIKNIIHNYLDYQESILNRKFILSDGYVPKNPKSKELLLQTMEEIYKKLEAAHNEK